MCHEVVFKLRVIPESSLSARNRSLETPHAVPAGVSAREAAPPAWVTKAKAQLAQLTVKPAAPMTGYSRDKFR